jgi:endonuclease-8
MPEGDTLHTIARVLHPVLAGERLERAWLRAGGGAVLRARTVRAVFAVGKHLIVHFEPTRDRRDALRVHLGMPGSWHLVPAGGALRRDPRSLVVRLGTRRHDALCFAAPQVELGALAEMRTRGALSRLGPDLLGEAPDLAAIAAAASQTRPIAEVLLDQTIASGIGNVYKSELCFWAGVSPRTPAAALSPAAREALYAQARRWMSANLGPWMRVTTGPPPGPGPGAGERLWVYGRAGRPCLRCGAPIEKFRQGSPSRVSYRCPRCQPDAEPVGAACKARFGVGSASRS